MKKLLIGLIAVGSLIAANAQDKALLETLVKKGMLTQQEAAQIAKESVAVTPMTKSTKSIKIFGGGQGWYTWQQYSNKVDPVSSPVQTSGFTLRYVKLGVEADVGGGWSATVVTDFGSEGAGTNYLDKVIASKKIDYDYLNGTLQMGLRKSNMGYEQDMDDFGQLAIERSVATYFFTRANYNDSGVKNFGSRTVGVFWDGNIIQVDGLYYSLAVTSEVTESATGTSIINNVGNSSSLSFYAAMGYKTLAEINGESVTYDFGVNFGYAPQGMETATGARGSIWGINPYASVNWRGFTFIGEFFLQQVEDYSAYPASGDCRTPIGANATVAYKWDVGELGILEPVGRFSYVYANGLGMTYAPYYFGSTTNPTAFNQATTLYVGLNWYATSAVKTSLGYEFGYFDNANSTPNERYYGNTVRAQVQVLF